jgi:hypothetical protein
MSVFSFVIVAEVTVYVAAHQKSTEQIKPKTGYNRTARISFRASRDFPKSFSTILQRKHSPMKPPIPLRSRLFLFTHTANDSPYAISVNIKRIYVMLTFFSFGFLILFFGSLLFFREVEMNRHLEDRVLQLETRDQLWCANNPLPTGDGISGTQSGFRIPMALPNAFRAETSVPVARELDQAAPAAAVSNDTFVKPRIEEFEVECTADSCSLTLSMVPTHAGVSQGRLLFVLESEVPRIGTSAVSSETQIREKYMTYPGNLSMDSFSPEDIANQPTKPFHFGRALQTSAEFKVGKLLRPLAANVYILAPDNTLLLHERKVIDPLE